MASQCAGISVEDVPYNDLLLSFFCIMQFFLLRSFRVSRMYTQQAVASYHITE